jgi:hypothetical protein
MSTITDKQSVFVRRKESTLHVDTFLLRCDFNTLNLALNDPDSFGTWLCEKVVQARNSWNCRISIIEMNVGCRWQELVPKIENKLLETFIVAISQQEVKTALIRSETRAKVASDILVFLIGEQGLWRGQ